MNCHHPPSQSLLIFEALISDVAWCEVLGVLEALLPNVVDECNDLVFHSFGRCFAVGCRTFRTTTWASLMHTELSLSRSLPCSSDSQRIRTRHRDHHSGIMGTRCRILVEHSSEIPDCSLLHFIASVPWHSGSPTCIFILGLLDCAPRCRHL